jgi:hypothetical protein
MEERMNSNCRHIMTGGCQCGAYALTGEPFCYFHSRLHRAAKQPVNLIDSIEIPLLEDRCAVQVVVTRVLRALVNKSLDRQTASTLLYGLQLALQSVDRSSFAVGLNSVEAISQTPDGDEIAADPDDEELEDDEYDEDDQDDENDEGEQDDEGDEDTDSDPEAEDSGESADEDGSDVADDAEEDDKEAIKELLAEHKYLQSVKLALQVDDMRQVARLLNAGG